MGVYIWSNNPRLPAEYQEVEYIQNSGNLYINSGYAPNQDTKAELKFSNWTESGSNDVFGTDKNFANSGFTLLSTVPCYGNQTITVSKNVADGNLHIITLGKDGYVVDGELITTFNTQTFSSLNLYLFALNRNGSAREYAHYRFYYMKIWDNGTLVRDFIPCYRKSDDVIGLYDLVNSQFYTKSGSGTFTKGSNVIYFERELQNAYIGEYGWQPGANTIAYYPLKSDILDHSGNNNNFTGGTYTFSDNFIDVTTKLTGPVTLPNGGTGPRTISMWTCVPSGDTRAFSYLPATSDGGPNCYVSGRDTENGNRPGAGFYYYGWKRNRPASVSVGEKFLMTWVKEGAVMRLYLNAELVSTTNLNSSGTWNPPGPRAELLPGKYSEIIVEDQTRDTTMISEYYNLTKSNYGL